MTNGKTPPPLVRPKSARERLQSAAPIIKHTEKFLRDKSPDDKALLSALLSGTKARGIQRWALEMQQITHSPYGNLLSLFFFRFADAFPGTITEKMMARVIANGVAVGPATGHFTSLDHLDPTEPIPKKPVDPRVEEAKFSAFVDTFTSVDYDVGYRMVNGALSQVLQLTYQDGTRLDLDFRLVSDNLEPAPSQVFAHAFLGAADRIFPLRMSPETTGNLWRAKQQALAEIEKSNQDFETFLAISLAAINSALPVGPIVGVAPLSTGGYRPVRTGRTARAPAPASQRPAPTSPPAHTQSGEINTRGVPANRTGSTASQSNTPLRASTPASPAGASRVASNAGYRYGDGEVIGQVSQSELPSAPYGTGPYGRRIEEPIVRIIRKRYPRTRFRFRTNDGETGPDVEWVGGEDPGFDLGDIKPFSDSGFKKFQTQVRRNWRAGPASADPNSFDVVFFGYERDGSVTTVGGKVGGGRPAQ